MKPIPRFGKVILKGNLVSKFIEKDKERENWINGGFFVCEKKIFNYLNKKNTIFESDTLTYLAKKKNLLSFVGFKYVAHNGCPRN